MRAAHEVNALPQRARRVVELDNRAHGPAGEGTAERGAEDEGGAHFGRSIEDEKSEPVAENGRSAQTAKYA